MQTFRHKTVKKSFKEPYLVCMATNVAACVGLVGAWRFSPRAKAAMAAQWAKVWVCVWVGTL